MSPLIGTRAYQHAARQRSPREQEADVFRQVNAALRAAQGDMLAEARALADNGRLWLTVMDAMRDPANRLPETVRAAVISVGHAIRREADAATPDLGFILGVNEDMAAGLAGA